MLFSYNGGNGRGIVKNVTTENGALCMGDKGLWISHALDSSSPGTVWDKAEITFSTDGAAYFRFTAIASDEQVIELNDEKANIGDILREALENGAPVPEAINAVSFMNPRCAPLFGLKGRYLWFAVSSTAEKDGKVSISKIELSCPHRSLMNALPGIFSRKDDGSLNALLAMYKSVIDSTDKEIVCFGKRLDPCTASGDDLKRLIEWQGVRVSEIWGEEKLRRIAARSSELIRLKGTRAAISELFDILLGEPPEIEEKTEEYLFTVTVDYEKIPSGRHYAELLRMLEDFTPVGVTGRIVLKNYEEKLRGDLESGLVLSDDPFGSGFII